jgi:hypothetical protein
VDSDHDVAPREDVELPPKETVVRRFVGFDRLDGQMDRCLVADEAGATGLLEDAIGRLVRDVEGIDDGREAISVATVDVDPQQLLAFEARNNGSADDDVAVTPRRVIEAALKDVGFCDLSVTI